MVGRGEIDPYREALLEQGVIVKLGSVVERERLEVATVSADRAGGRSGHLSLVAGGELLDDSEPGLAFDQGEHAVAHVPTHHDVTIPMANLSAVFYLDGSVVDRSLAGQHSS